MGRNKKEELINAVPEKLEKRSDRLHYWLSQRNMPELTGPNRKAVMAKTTVFDRMIIGMIEKASEGNASCFNAIMENAFGKNTEGADVTMTKTNAGAKFNIPMTVSELKKEESD